MFDLFGHGTSEGVRKAWESRQRAKQKTKERSARAKATHHPVTKDIRDKHNVWVNELVRSLPGAQATSDNEPMDIIGKTFALECRTWQLRLTDRIDMHPSSRERKLQFLAKNKLKGYVVVKDLRVSGKQTYYVKEGMAAWRVSVMTKMPNFESVISFIKKGK